MTLVEDAALAADLVREAGELAAQMRGEGLRTETKSSRTDLVTAADRAAERLITDHLAAFRPTDGVLGEEAGRAQEQALLVGLAGEVSLREGRPLVGQGGLVAHQGDRVPEPALPQGGGELEAGLPGPGHDDPGAHALAPAGTRPPWATPGRLRAPSDIR